jgi:hypothetical protein
MPDDQIMFRILLRSPIYPVIVISADRLRTAHNLNTLAVACLRSTPPEGKEHVTIIDTSARGFEYDLETVSVMPSFFMMKPLSKKRLVDLYNQSANARESGEYYSERSLNNKPLARVIADLCHLIKSNNRGKDR